MSKIKVIDKSEKVKCWTCEDKESPANCPTCNGTGIWKEDNFIIVAEYSKGNKIAFQVDQAGK